MKPTHAYCPACREESALDHMQRCLWCGGPTEERPKRGGWKRPDLRGSKFTHDQLRVLHVMHMRGSSANSLAAQVYERVGYGSQASALTAMLREWKRLGLKSRDRIEATIAVSTKHGLAPKHGPRPGYARYKRVVLHGNEDRQCAAVRNQAPRKGDPCNKPPLAGSDFCFAHDPEWAEWRDLHLANARAQAPECEMVSMAPLTRWLKERRAELGSWSAVGECVGRTGSLVHRYGRGLDTSNRPKAEIARTTVEDLLDADGTTTFEQLYLQAEHPSAQTPETARVERG